MKGTTVYWVQMQYSYRVKLCCAKKEDEVHYSFEVIGTTVLSRSRLEYMK